MTKLCTEICENFSAIYKDFLDPFYKLRLCHIFFRSMAQPSSSMSSTKQITLLRSRRSNLDSLQLWKRSPFQIAQSTPTSASVFCLAGPSSKLSETSSSSSTSSRSIPSTLCLSKSKRFAALHDFCL